MRRKIRVCPLLENDLQNYVTAMRYSPDFDFEFHWMADHLSNESLQIDLRQLGKSNKKLYKELRKIILKWHAVDIAGDSNLPRPPFNAEYLIYLLLRKEERDVVIGDLIEDYGKVLERFGKPRADFWFYKQVAGSLFPLLRRALFRIGALVWLGQVLRRLIS
jgi:hypothetical protein